MSVIGIDFGNSNSRVASAGKGGVDVLLNGISKRDNASLVSFGEKERHIGERGADQFVRNATNSVTSVKRFIGLQYDCPEIDAEKQYATCEINRDSESSDIVFRVNYNNEEHSFRPEQVVAMILTELRDIANSNRAVQNGKITQLSCVLSCPAYFTQNQRRALLNACEIADIDCLSLLNETTAAALDYGIFKSAEFPTSDSSKGNGANVCFIDVGHSATTASVVSFYATEMKVIATCFDENLGTRNIDMILLQYFRDRIAEKYNFDVLTNKKARIRLLQACQKVKTTLSANPVTSISLECLFEDTDVHFPSFTRDEFETLIEDFTNRYEAVCTRILSAVTEGCHGDFDIAAMGVELIGGGSRIPMVKNVTQTIFGSTPRSTLNATETVSKGCAVYAAMLSPNFRVKEYKISDIALYNTKIGYHSPLTQIPSGAHTHEYPFLSQDINKIVSIVKAGDTIPKVFDVSFEREESFDVYTFYENSSDSVLCNRFTPAQLLLNYSTVTNVSTELPSVDNILSRTNKVKLRFKINVSGVIDIVSAQVVTEYDTQENAKSASKDLEAGTVDPEQSGDHSCTANESAPVEKRTKKERKTSQALIEKHPIPSGMTPEQMMQTKKEEKQMYAQDILIQKTAETRNTLEECFYDYRYKITDPNGELYRFADQKDISKFEKLCSENNAWLESDEGYDANIEAYTARLEPMKAIITGAVYRFRNHSDIPLSVQEFNTKLNDLRAKAAALKTEAEGGWHTEQEMEGIYKQLDDAHAWISEKSKVAESRALYEEPVLTKDGIQGKLREIDMVVTPLLNKRKPIPPKPEAKPKEEDQKKEEMNVDSEASQEQTGMNVD